MHNPHNASADVVMVLFRLDGFLRPRASNATGTPRAFMGFPCCPTQRKFIVPIARRRRLDSSHRRIRERAATALRHKLGAQYYFIELSKLH